MSPTSHYRVCVKCGRFLEVERMGVHVIEWAEVRPYRIWRADLVKCPECGVEVIVAFGGGPLARGGEEKMERLMKELREGVFGPFVEAFHTARSKREATGG